VNYVGIDLVVDGFTVASVSGDAAKFSSAVRPSGKRQASFDFDGRDPVIMAAGLKSAQEGSINLWS
jgi:CO dehydrogenase/acetyl-CoA synthase gamma subunit (corrinoid Fe-S protein)